MASIFELGDKFGGINSPFGDWMAEERMARATAEQKRAQFSPPALIVPNYKRIIFYGGSKVDDGTFGQAADHVNSDYTDVKAEKFHIVDGGQSIVDKINAFEIGTLQSVDFLAHGGPKGLYFKHRDNDDPQNLYMNDYREQEDGVTHWSNVFSSDKNEYGADIAEINFSVFTDNAKVEMLGCNAAKIDPDNMGYNFAREFSVLLWVAGKKSAVAVGHIESANPDSHTTLVQPDYRHGTRRIYHAGEVLFLTRMEGRIPANLINRYLNKKALQGKKYDGNKEKTW